MGKRICIGLQDDLWLVLHLMIAGRLHWRERGVKVARPRGLAALDFSDGSLLWTEASSQKRASLHVIVGEDNLRALDPAGIEVLDSSLEQFAVALRAENHTLKRTLTDPRIFSGIGNAYSDEILFEARLSPMQLTQNLTDEEAERLYTAVRATLIQWTDRLRAEAGGKFPEKVTAFREAMAVHGKYKQPCPRCGHACSTHPVCQQRSQLLSPLPDWRQATGRPCSLSPLARRLAQDPRRAGVIRREASQRLSVERARSPCSDRVDGRQVRRFCKSYLP